MQRQGGVGKGNAQGIVHRDVKLGNVLLSAEGHVVLSDFGVSRFFSKRLRTDVSAVETMISEVGASARLVMGTQGYLAPEVQRGEVATPASDAYALGVLFVRLLTGIWYEPGARVFKLLESFDYRWIDVLPHLLAEDPAARKAGRKTRSEVADAALRLVGEADTEAAKLLLMKGAFVLYVRDGNLEKAVETMNGLERTIAGLPPQSVTNMVETALLGVADKSGTRAWLQRRLAASGGPRPAAPPAADATKRVPPRATVQSIIDGMIKVPGRDCWLSATEVTQGQWEAVMGSNPSRHKGANLPVENVSRDDCDAFLEKLNATREVLRTQLKFGLPTLPEWMYAAQAGGTNLDCWIRPGVAGSVLDMAWVAENSSNETHAVAAKAPNAFGFYDMLGNVWEWMDCKEPNVGCRHGGSFCNPAADCTVRKGHHNPRNQRLACYGFRLAAHVWSGAETSPDEF